MSFIIILFKLTNINTKHDIVLPGVVTTQDKSDQ